MTQIQQIANNSYVLTTEKGREIQVTFSSWNTVNVFVGTGTGYGRNYNSLAEAVTNYKAVDVKAALSALADHYRYPCSSLSLL